MAIAGSVEAAPHGGLAALAIGFGIETGLELEQQGVRRPALGLGFHAVEALVGGVEDRFGLGRGWGSGRSFLRRRTAGDKRKQESDECEPGA